MTKIDHEHIRECSLRAEDTALVQSSKLYQNHFKRIVDVCFVLLTLPVALPLIAFLALLVKLGGGSPFYSQERVGKDGRVFRIWKLRTMVHDADARLESILSSDPAVRREWESSQKLKNDPRITPLGRFLRKSSADELPQLFNVLNGTMSLVGPRPFMPCQRDQYHGTAYYQLRPGITGFWQISDRNESEFVARVYYDELYLQTVSLQTDLKILARTFFVVFKCTGH